MGEVAEKNYQLEAKNKGGMSEDEGKKLKDINTFLLGKEYQKGKDLIEGKPSAEKPLTQEEQDIKNKHEKIKDKVHEKLDENGQKEALKIRASSLIGEEIKKYGFEGIIDEKPVSEVIFEKLKNKYDETIDGYNTQEASQKYKKIDMPRNIFGADLKKDMNEIMGEYNRQAILGMFVELGGIDDKTKELVKDMLDETTDAVINNLGRALNYSEEVKTDIITDLTKKIETHNKNNPDNPLVKFGNATTDEYVNGILQKGKDGQGTRKTGNESVSIDNINTTTLDAAISKLLETRRTVGGTKNDVIKIQVPKNTSTETENAIIAAFKTNSITKDLEIGKIEKVNSISRNINMAIERPIDYKTALKDYTFEVPVEPKDILKKQIDNLLKDNPGDNTIIHIQIPSTGNESVMEQINTIKNGLSPADQDKIQIDPISDKTDVSLYAEVVEYENYDARLDLPYDAFGNSEKVAAALPNDLKEKLQDKEYSIVSGEIYGSASYQHTDYKQNTELENWGDVGNTEKITMENRTVDGQIVTQKSTNYDHKQNATEKDGSVTNNPTLAKDRALSFLDYIDGQPNKIDDLKNIKISYGVNGPTLEEAKKQVNTTNNTDDKLKDVFAPYQYAQLKLQFKKTIKTPASTVTLNTVATSNEGFQIKIIPESATKTNQHEKKKGTHLKRFPAAEVIRGVDRCGIEH